MAVAVSVAVIDQHICRLFINLLLLAVQTSKTTTEKKIENRKSEKKTFDFYFSRLPVENLRLVLKRNL